jgi:tol-pal system protein YbgF
MRQQHLTAALICGLILAVPASQAGMFDDEEARKQIVELRRANDGQFKNLDARLNELEALMRSRSVIDLFNQVEQIRADMNKLRGQQEVFANELEQTQKRQRDLYVDADTRLRKLETTATLLAEQNKAQQEQIAKLIAANQAAAANPAQAPAAAPAVVVTTPAPPLTVAAQPAPPAIDLAAEQRSYDQAFNEFRNGRYTEAATAFLGFLKNYPRSALAPSAQYWVGNSLFGRKDFRGAIREQRVLVSQYPDSSKVPDALLNIASSHRELNEPADERRALQELISKYPASDAAVKAKQRLR